MNGRTVALDTARQYVIKDRNSRHGDPEDNFLTIAQMWQAYADRRGWTTEFTRSDVAMLCILLKAARAANDPSYLDNYIDIIGYGACAYEVAELETSYVVPGELDSLEGQIDALDLDTVSADIASYPNVHSEDFDANEGPLGVVYINPRYVKNHLLDDMTATFDAEKGT